MIKYKAWFIAVMAAFSGILLGFMFVNPYGGRISLSELILQLSGSRGEFVLGHSLSELVSFAMRMIPSYILEGYLGIYFYRHFCVAAVYVFSRYPNRKKWYLKELSYVGIYICLFQAVLLAAVIGVTEARYSIGFDLTGFILMTYHFLIHSLWIYIIVIVMNLLAIRFGSGTAFSCVVGGQIICVTLLGLARYSDILTALRLLVKYNPIAHLILGWHSSSIETVNQVLTSSYLSLNLNTSLIIYTIICIVLISTGKYIVARNDILISDSKTGEF